MKTLVGETLALEYEVIDALGHGATSVVYKAREISSGEIVALKVLHPYLIQKTDTFKRFEQEAQLATLLEHPNIVKVRRYVSSEENKPFLVQDYIEGETLATILAREKYLALPRAWNLFIQLADALEHAHQRGVVHRHLKPGNVIISVNENGQEFAHIADFGIAKLLPSSGQEIQDLTQKGAVLGSPLFMSPEQCLGRSIDGRADIYSLGCLMYMVLSGRPPLKGDHMIDTMAKHVSDIPAPFSQICPELNLPLPVQAIVFKCIAKLPEERYDSMEALKLDLLRFQQGKSPKAPLDIPAATEAPPPASQQTDARISLQTKFALFALLAVVVFSLGFIGFMRKSKNDEAANKIIEAVPTKHLTGLSPNAILREAHEMRMHNRQQEAELLYRQAITRAKELSERDPANKDILCLAHEGLGELLMRMDRTADAREEFEKALYIMSLATSEDTESKFRVREDICDCLLHEGHLDEAEKTLKQILKDSRDPVTRARAQLLYSSIEFVRRNFDMTDKRLADAMHELAQTNYPGDMIVILARRVDLLVSQGKLDQASAILSRIRSTMIRNASMQPARFNANGEELEFTNTQLRSSADVAIFASVELARIDCAKGRVAAAIEMLKGTQEVARQANEVRRMDLTDALAACYFLNGNVAEASAALNIDEIDLGDRLGHSSAIIRMYVLSKQYDKAVKMINELKSEKSINTQKKAELYSLLAFSRLKQGEKEKALNAIDKALKLIDKSPVDDFRQECWNLKCKILRAAGRADAAEVIEKYSFPPQKEFAAFDEVLPLYHHRIQLW